MSLHRLMGVGVMVCVAGTAAADGLADAARREAERRAKLASASPAPVITQENIGTAGNGGTFTQMGGPAPLPYRPDGRTMTRPPEPSRRASATSPPRPPTPSPVPTPPGSQPVPTSKVVCQEGVDLTVTKRMRGTGRGEKVCTTIYNPYNVK